MFNNILPIVVRSAGLYHQFGVPNQISVCNSRLTHAFYMLMMSASPLFYPPNNVSWGVQGCDCSSCYCFFLLWSRHL